jgi:hypothetical protein
MKFETLFLRGLFGTCVLVCGLMLLAMVSAKPVSATATSSHAIAAAANATAVQARAAG